MYSLERYPTFGASSGKEHQFGLLKFTEPTNSATTSWLKEMKQLQEVENAEIEDPPTEEEEFVDSVYLLKGRVFSISKDSQEAIKVLFDQLREALPDTGQRSNGHGKSCRPRANPDVY